ncbi:hypothetical protein Cni_G12276 [Canna indica]|uniref:F-box domain-containing protein n=1 Tax=Canna indica TaxID=4628 RepID=A0AAQ3QBM9_9LILI|nr:hypothetical protein Cni_G12276 [Canna indica]
MSQGAAMVSSNFEWERLPPDLQQSILLLLPISTLLVCKSLSRSFLRTIRSDSFISAYSSLRRHSCRREDVLLLLFSDFGQHDLATAFLPSRSRCLPIRLPPSIAHIHASDGSLVVASTTNGFGGDMVSDVLCNTVTPIPPRVPHSYILALIEEEASPNFKIVAVDDKNSVRHIKVYDSRLCRWEIKGMLAIHYAMLGNAVVLDDLLFVLGQLPDHLLAFDPDTRTLSVVSVDLPFDINFHLLVFERRLFLVGGMVEVGIVVRIGIWELDLGDKEWRVFCFMPDEVFQEFSGNDLGLFQTTGRLGYVCFCNTRWSIVVAFDMALKTWSWPPKSDMVPTLGRSWLGHALELPVKMLRT